MGTYIKKSDITAILEETNKKLNSLPEATESDFWQERAKANQSVIDYQKSKISSLETEIANLNEYKNYLKSANETLKKMLHEAWAKQGAMKKSLMEET